MDDLFSMVTQQFEEDTAKEEPIKEEIKNEEIIKERFKTSDEHIKKRKEMIELSKMDKEDVDEVLRKRAKDRQKNHEPEKKKEEKKTYGYGGYGYSGYGSSSSDKKDSSTKTQEKATEYADSVFDALKTRVDKEMDKEVPEDWDIFDIHHAAKVKHTIAKDTKKGGKLPFKVKAKLATLKALVYVGHSTLETLYVLKND